MPSTLFISVWVHAIIAANKDENPPTLSHNIQCDRRSHGINREHPGNKVHSATTIVAACISADTGVGPSIASGSHIWNGNIADFPAPPR